MKKNSGGKRKTIEEKVKEIDAYLNRLEANRLRDEPNNKRAYAQARQLAGILSLFRYGNPAAKEMAERVIMKGW